MKLISLEEKLNEIQTEKNYVNQAILCRELLELAVDYIYDVQKVEKPKMASVLELVDSSTVTLYLNDDDLINSLHYVRILGNNAKHQVRVREKEAKLAISIVSSLIDFLDAKGKGKSFKYKTKTELSEEDTRKLYVDLYLKEAGWDVLTDEGSKLPSKAGIEIGVKGMPFGTGTGRCDYVLYGKDCKPLAIVEVKRTSKNPEDGRHQVDLYASCMEKEDGYKPVMYYTNGYSTWIIDGLYPDRKVMAFHSLQDLEWMIQKRNRKSILDKSINDEITGRPYQKIAITKICESFEKMHRRGLLVMATGTGKTRTAISLVDVLTRNKWVKTVLFLADRTALVNQAKRNFAKLLPSMSICELSAAGEKDYNARLMFCTYQTMINYIDAEDKKFTSGRFDLIIIDEAHRSIFNRYGSIFEYFDGLLVGLTATPKNEVDANTYKIFGCDAGTPNYDYSLEEAIKDKYLVGYKVINRTSKLISDGIKYKDLSNSEKEQIEDYVAEDIPTPDFTIPGNEVFKHIFNKDTCKKVLEELMRWGLKVDNGETIGKTIIFAFNHKHAQMIVECFHELYPSYPANTCQLVDYQVSYGEDLVIKFGEDKEFRIAVSVDMLDTGVDIPEVLNLVFFKKVRSKIKFVQMIGRGTRLCENVFGSGKHKKEFLIFDYCGNFEYFNERIDEMTGKDTISLSQRLFEVRLNMLYELQHLKYQQDEWYKGYYNSIKKQLQNEIKNIKSHKERIQVRKEMLYVDKYSNAPKWTSLTAVEIQEIKKHLGILIDGGLAGNSLSVAFDIRVFHIELALLREETKEAGLHIKIIRLIAKYLISEKASITQVLEKSSELKKAASEEYWKDVTVPELENLRIALRDLMKFLEGAEKSKIDVDIADEIVDSSFIPDDTSIDIRTYREKVIDYLSENSDSPVVKKIHNLEPLNDSDLEELEKVLWHELGSKDDYQKETHADNLAVFVRSLIGISQGSVNEKFGKYLSDNRLNSMQQEFIKNIIEYVRENGDIELDDIVNNEPFSDYDLNELFGKDYVVVVDIVKLLHNAILGNVA